MIAVVVSSVNKCFYCLTAHGQAVRELSDDPILGEMLVMNYRVADRVRQRAMLNFAEKSQLKATVLKNVIALTCGRLALAIKTFGTSRMSRPFSTCQTAWPVP